MHAQCLARVDPATLQSKGDRHYHHRLMNWRIMSCTCRLELNGLSPIRSLNYTYLIVQVDPDVKNSYRNTDVAMESQFGSYIAAHGANIAIKNFKKHGEKIWTKNETPSRWDARVTEGGGDTSRPSARVAELLWYWVVFLDMFCWIAMAPMPQKC